MILQTANYVQASRYGNGGVFGIGSQQKIIESKSLWETLVIVASLWKDPNTENGLKEIIAKKYASLDHDDIQEAFRIIKQDNFLIEPDVFDFEDRYSRNKLYFNQLGGKPIEVQQKLETKTVTIIGCGGIGNHVAYMLATSGIKKIVLVDDDYIEMSNLTRQVLFTEDDINLQKTAVLKRELQKRNRKVEIEIIEQSVRSVEDLDSLPASDLYIVSADYPAELIDWVNVSCVKNQQPYINIGYINDISVVGPFYIPGITSCFHCENIVPDLSQDEPLKEELAKLAEGFKTSTFAPVNGVSASFATGDIIRFLGEFGDIVSINKRVGIFSNSATIQEQPIGLNKDCKVCQV